MKALPSGSRFDCGIPRVDVLHGYAPRALPTVAYQTFCSRAQLLQVHVLQLQKGAEIAALQCASCNARMPVSRQTSANDSIGF